MKNKAFTLIEVLIAVLIIGILAAIAVPQYKRAVAKAKLTQLISIVNPLVEAQDSFYLVNGYYASDINLLDISVKAKSINCQVLNFWVWCADKNLIYLTFLTHHYANGGQIWCGSRDNSDSEYDNVCKDMFGHATDVTTKMRSWVNVRKGWRVK